MGNASAIQQWQKGDTKVFAFMNARITPGKSGEKPTVHPTGGFILKHVQHATYGTYVIVAATPIIPRKVAVLLRNVDKEDHMYLVTIDVSDGKTPITNVTNNTTVQMLDEVRKLEFDNITEYDTNLRKHPKKLKIYISIQPDSSRGAEPTQSSVATVTMFERFTFKGKGINLDVQADWYEENYTAYNIVRQDTLSFVQEGRRFWSKELGTNNDTVYKLVVEQFWPAEKYKLQLRIINSSDDFLMADAFRVSRFESFQKHRFLYFEEEEFIKFQQGNDIQKFEQWKFLQGGLTTVHTLLTEEFKENPDALITVGYEPRPLWSISLKENGFRFMLTIRELREEA